jgi:hypothetical protein
LQVIFLLTTACPGVSVPPFVLSPAAKPATGLGLQCLGRLSSHQVDGAAHGAGAVEHRRITLLNLHFGDVGGQEPAEIEPVVRGKVDADAIEHQPHLPSTEAA